MNIGYDGKRAFQNKTGLGNYTRSLLSALAHYYPGEQYTLFAPRITDLFKTVSFPQIHVKVPERFFDKKFPALWRSKRIVNDIVAAGMDIYHGASNELPAGIQKTKVKTVVTVHDLIFERYPETYHFEEKFVHRWKIKNACVVSDAIIAASKQTKADLIHFYKVPEHKISVCYQSCNPAFGKMIPGPDKELIRKKYGLPGSFFLAVGSITPRKNLLTICEAMLVLKGKKDISLVIIGDGKKEKEKIKEFMDKHGMGDQLLFLNELPQSKEESFINGSDFPAIYQQATALIYPSIFEGFGIPLLEALWSGVPVISSNTSSLPEVGGEAALYFLPYDHELLAQHMMQVMTDKNIVMSMREKGFIQAKKFSDQHHAESVMQVYQHLV